MNTITIFVCLLVAATSAQSWSDLPHVNFSPYTPEACGDDVSTPPPSEVTGIGFSFIANRCLQYGDSNAYMFNVDNSGQVSWAIYNTTQCKGAYRLDTAVNGTCRLVRFGDMIATYSLVTVSPGRTYPADNAYVQYQYKDSSCPDGGYQVYTYVTFDTVIYEPYPSTETIEYTCQENYPMETICQNPSRTDCKTSSVSTGCANVYSNTYMQSSCHHPASLQ
eukprot:gene10262-11968_t